MTADANQPNPQLSPELQAKFARMRERLRELGSVAVAFSAGVDSTFVLKVALDTLGAEHVLAVTARSPSVPRFELAEAERLALSIGAPHAFVDTNEFESESYTSNPTNRCYYCKTTLYSHLANVLRERGIRWIVNGTNTDDLGDWRPGLQAATEHNVIAPAVEAGMSKRDIRALSEWLGLDTADKPASPCLSSRIPYGRQVTPEKLRMVEAGEAFLRERFELRECRVRHYDELARIEIPHDRLEEFSASDAMDAITAHFRELGFQAIEIDSRGLRSGALNEVIAFGTRQGESAMR